MRTTIGVSVSALVGLCGVTAGQSVVVLPTPVRRVSDVSDDGTRVIGYGAGATHYFWGMQDGLTLVNHLVTGAAGLPQLSGNGHTLTSISRETSTFQRAFIATDSGGYTVLPFTGAGASQAFPFAVSYDGSVVAGYDNYLTQGIDVGWRWTAAGGMQTLPLLVGAMSGDGNTLVGYDGGLLAPVWRNGTVTRLPIAPGTAQFPGTGASSINYDGSIIGGSSSSVPAIWRNGVGTALPLLPGTTDGTVRDISNDGNTALGTFGSGSSLVNFVWTAAGGTQELGAYFASRGISLPGYTIQEVHMSANGQVFGLTAFAGDLVQHGLVITLPAPASLLAFTCLLTLKRRER